jgi:hypothetical protein
VNNAPLLDRPTIERIFRRQGERPSAHGVVADLFVFGGGAIGGTVTASPRGPVGLASVGRGVGEDRPHVAR